MVQNRHYADYTSRKIIDPSDSGVLVGFDSVWISIVFTVRNVSRQLALFQGHLMGHHCTGGLEGEPGYTERDKASS
jgi:hypothetical protein